MSDEAAILFRELADLTPAERERFYIRKDVPPRVRAEVESLLHFDNLTSDAVAGTVAAAANDYFNGDSSLPSERRCGPYRLERLLGTGGMGSVYLAERADGEVQQSVAIKFLRPEADAPAVRERFLRERQILATLNHSGIARLLDAGRTEQHHPYLVMEYIEGTPIDVYAKNLDVRGILVLFLTVCDAVSYAHRNLVIHRDLKPSNILIDGDGQAKLLDFGIAKIVDAVEVTRTVERLMTPGYASPEQLRGEARTTATDIYSLGAVLYRLLTGRTPRAGLLDGPLQVVEPREEFILPSHLNAELPSDLDFILLKALRKEPEERYDSIDDFADDVRAFLEYRPVQARTGDLWYRTRKFLRRYWPTVVAAMLTIAGLSVGLYVANRERNIAQRRFQQVRQLSNEVLALDTDLRRLPGAANARHRLVGTALRYLERLGPEAQKDKDLALEIGSGYAIVAQAQGVPTVSNLGDLAGAEDSLRKAEAFIDTALKADPSLRAALFLSAEVSHDRMIVAETTHRNTEALAHARKASQRLDAILTAGTPGPEPGLSPGQVRKAATFYAHLAQAHLNMHYPDEAVRYARRSAEISRAAASTQDIHAISLSLLAMALRFGGELDAALQTIREARALIEKASSPDVVSQRTNLFNVCWREGVILGGDGAVNLNRTAEAIAALQRALDLAEGLAIDEPNDSSSRIRLTSASRELGGILRHSDPQRALLVYDHAFHRLQEVKKSVKVQLEEVHLLAGSSYALRSLHRAAEARQRIDDAFANLRLTKDYPASQITAGGEAYLALRALADHYSDTGHPVEAIATYEELLNKVLASKPAPETDLRHANSLSIIYQGLAALHRRNGNAAQAGNLEARRLEIWRHWDQKLPKNAFVARQLASTAK